VITNERQYRITRNEAARFAEALQHAETAEPSFGVHPEIHQAMIDGLRSQLDELQMELRDYEALREGKVRQRSLSSLLDLPLALIEGRIARRMTQKQLGNKVGLPEQQIQRYEGTRYAGASLARLQEIADAIGLKLKKVVEFDVPDLAVASGPRSTSSTRRSGRSEARRSGSTAKRTTAKRRTAKRSTAKRSTAKRSTTKRSTAKRSTTKRSTTERSTAKRSTTKRSTAKRATAKRSTAKRSTAKRSTAKRR
jgi:transcriptional regulator with XRE-family HTH domain